MGQAAADEAKKTQEAADKKAKEIQDQIDDLNEHATAAQKKAREAAAQATNDATAAAKKALAAEAAAAHAKKVEEEQKKIVAETAQKAAENKKAAAAKDALAAKIKSEADAAVKEANLKKAAANSMLAKIDNAQCKKHKACKGLVGYCCPTLNFGKMHLGSAKLDGESMVCCGAAEELANAPSLDREIEASSHGFGVISLLVAAATGSLMTALVLQMSMRKEDKKGYERLVAA